MSSTTIYADTGVFFDLWSGAHSGEGEIARAGTHLVKITPTDGHEGVGGMSTSAEDADNPLHVRHCWEFFIRFKFDSLADDQIIDDAKLVTYSVGINDTGQAFSANAGMASVAGIATNVPAATSSWHDSDQLLALTDVGNGGISVPNGGLAVGVKDWGVSTNLAAIIDPTSATYYTIVISMDHGFIATFSEFQSALPDDATESRRPKIIVTHHTDAAASELLYPKPYLGVHGSMVVIG